jgi:hypothetical protein
VKLLFSYKSTEEVHNSFVSNFQTTASNAHKNYLHTIHDFVCFNQYLQCAMGPEQYHKKRIFHCTKK